MIDVLLTDTTSLVKEYVYVSYFFLNVLLTLIKNIYREVKIQFNKKDDLYGYSFPTGAPVSKPYVVISKSNQTK